MHIYLIDFLTKRTCYVPKSIYFYVCVFLSASRIILASLLLKFSCLSSTFSGNHLLYLELCFFPSSVWVLLRELQVVCFFFLFQLMDLCSFITHISEVTEHSQDALHKQVLERRATATSMIWLNTYKKPLSQLRLWEKYPILSSLQVQVGAFS